MFEPLIIPAVLGGAALLTWRPGIPTTLAQRAAGYLVAQPQDVQLPTTPEFQNLAKYAMWQASSHEDPILAFGAVAVPIHTQAYPTQPQIDAAGGCSTCTFLGLWADSWPGYPPAAHGHIWLFEQGIRKFTETKGVPLADQVYETLVHELGHAAGYDHVLDELKERVARGQYWHPGLGSLGL